VLPEFLKKKQVAIEEKEKVNSGDQVEKKKTHLLKQRKKGAPTVLTKGRGSEATGEKKRRECFWHRQGKEKVVYRHDIEEKGPRVSLDV